ncbi:unnamed protein product [Rhizophagus irregularis]|nr:unnamed protein product [Rhizophagus irregularis]
MMKYYKTSSYQNEKNSQDSSSHQNRGKGHYCSDSYKDKRTHSRSHYSVSYQDKSNSCQNRVSYQNKVTVIRIEAEVKVITFLFFTGIKLEVKVEVDFLYKEDIKNSPQIICIIMFIKAFTKYL